MRAGARRRRGRAPARARAESDRVARFPTRRARRASCASASTASTGWTAARGSPTTRPGSALRRDPPRDARVELREAIGTGKTLQPVAYALSAEAGGSGACSISTRARERGAASSTRGAIDPAVVDPFPVRCARSSPPGMRAASCRGCATRSSRRIGSACVRRGTGVPPERLDLAAALRAWTMPSPPLPLRRRALRRRACVPRRVSLERPCGEAGRREGGGVVSALTAAELRARDAKSAHRAARVRAAAGARGRRRHRQDGDAGRARARLGARPGLGARRAARSRAAPARAARGSPRACSTASSRSPSPRPRRPRWRGAWTRRSRASWSGALPGRCRRRTRCPRRPLRAARAAALRGALDHLQVQTIHAWCRRLLAQHPLAAGVHPRFEVDADGRAARGGRRASAGRRGCAPPTTSPATRTLALAEARLRAAPSSRRRSSRCSSAASRAAELAAGSRRARAGRRAGPRGSRARARRFAARRRRRRARAARCSPRRREVLARSRAARRASRPRPRSLTREQLAALARSRCARLVPEPLRERLGAVGSADDFNEARAERRFGDARGRGVARRGARPARRWSSTSHPLDLALLDGCARAARAALGDAEQELRARGALGFAQLLRGAARLLAEQPEVAARAARRIDQLLVDEFQDTDRRAVRDRRALALDGRAAARPGPLPGRRSRSSRSTAGARRTSRAYEDFARRALGRGRRAVAALREPPLGAPRCSRRSSA